MISERFNDKYAPPINIARDNDDEVHVWASEGLKKGKNILRTQAAWHVAEIFMDILLGRDRIRRLQGVSVLTVRKLRRMLREQIAVQSNIRPRWGYKSPSSDEKKKDIASKFTKLLDFWWTMAFIDRKFRETIQYSGGTGTGYLCLDIDRNFGGIAGNVQISAHALDYRQFIPFHRMQNWDIQKLYAAAIYYEYDITEAHEKFPWAIDLIEADRKRPSRSEQNRAASIGVWRGVVDRIIRRKSKELEGESRTCDIAYIYVRDSSINTSGETIMMGEGEWKYPVLSYYSNEPTKFSSDYGYITEVPTGKVENIDNQEVPVTRRPTLEECMYYPNRRLIIWCTKGIIYDGPAQNLHGQIPISIFRLDDVAGELLGFPVTMDAKPVVDSANKILRTIEDAIHKKANPDLAIDKSVPTDVERVLKTPSVRQRIVRYSLSVLAKAVLPLIPHEYHSIDKDSYGFVDKLFEWADYLAGTKDTNNWSKLKQLPAGDTVEGILQATGDLPVDQSRNIESGFLPLGRIFLGLSLQIYNTRRLMEIVGVDEIANFMDFDPTNLVPLESKEDTRPRWLRAREFMQQFPFYASPNSLHERNSVTQQLKMFQARNVGITISDEEIFETVFPGRDFAETKRKYYIEQEKKIELALKLESKLNELRRELSGNNIATDLLNQLSNQGNNKEGRPPTNQAPARLEQKTTESGIPRTTLPTS